MPLAGDRGTDRGDRSERVAAPRRGPATNRRRHRGPGHVARGDRPRDLRGPVRPPADHGGALRAVSRRDGRPVVRRQGPRARHAPADERGDRGREWRAAVADGRPLGSQPRRGGRAQPADVGGRRLDRPRTRGSRRRAPGAASLPPLRQRGHPGRGARRGAQERRGHRGWCRRRPRVRRQRQGRAPDPRAGRDDAAGDRRRRQSADVRGARRDGGPHRDVRLAAVPEPPSRRGAGEGPGGPGPRSRRRCRGRRRARTRSRRRSPWPPATASSCPSPARSSSRCSKARASSAASSTCSPANRRTSSPTRRRGWPGSVARVARRRTCPRRRYRRRSGP